MLLRCRAACPPPGFRRATAHRSVRFVSILVSAFCPPYDSAPAEHALEDIPLIPAQAGIQSNKRWSLRPWVPAGVYPRLDRGRGRAEIASDPISSEHGSASSM